MPTRHASWSYALIFASCFAAAQAQEEEVDATAVNGIFTPGRAGGSAGAAASVAGDAVSEQPAGAVARRPAQMPRPAGPAAASTVSVTDPAAALTDSPAPAADTPGITNADVVDMVAADFGPTTIEAAIDANPSRFDVSPKALLALKRDGVPEQVIKAMLEAEAAKQAAPPAAGGAIPAAAGTVATPGAGAATLAADGAQPSPDMLAMLSQEVAERLAAQAAAAAPEGAGAPEPDLEPAPEHGPDVWALSGASETMLTRREAEIAYTDAKITDTTTFRTVRGIAGKALSFMNPALGLAGDVASGLFKQDDPKVTAVWALLGASAPQAFGSETVFRVHYDEIPGVDPDRYEPVIVELSPTSDNYRIVGAAEMRSGVPTDGIVEDEVATQSERIARGRYRLRLRAPAAPGEYALVLRPVEDKRRKRGRGASLGELMGGGSTEVLYMTWDFSIAR
ncbi:MAG: hypothetical protein JXB36_00815 [Gammaproteobacteria bacterium]|nr:hypothetical protein [Gammaproteobacteria bacterium]